MENNDQRMNIFFLVDLSDKELRKKIENPRTGLVQGYLFY
jgi:hypothetical protein